VAVLLSLASAACAAGADQAGSSEAAASEDKSLGLSDVTVLAPLPTPDALATMLGAKELVPLALGASIGQLVEQFAPEDTLGRLRVVCTRFDPCAPKPGGDPHACIGEVRLVLQPLLVRDGVVGAQDAAVHVFYDLDAATTRDVATRLAAMPGARAAGPLGVSARLSPQGGAYASKLDALVRELTSPGHGELSRVTFLRNVDVKGNGWTFGGFDVHGGVATPLTIPRVGGSEQRVVVNGGAWPFATSLSPAPSGDDTLGLLLDPPRLGILADASADGAKQRVATGFAAALALENPTRHDATTADCASCHVAASARTFARQFAAQRALGPLPEGGAYPGGAAADAAPATKAAETLRACGYVGDEPVISQRTVNDSVLAARRMGALLP
jgi:hypothetical protein